LSWGKNTPSSFLYISLDLPQMERGGGTKRRKEVRLTYRRKKREKVLLRCSVGKRGKKKTARPIINTSVSIQKKKKREGNLVLSPFQRGRGVGGGRGKRASSLLQRLKKREDRDTPTSRFWQKGREKRGKTRGISSSTGKERGGGFSSNKWEKKGKELVGKPPSVGGQKKKRKIFIPWPKKKKTKVERRGARPF